MKKELLIKIVVSIVLIVGLTIGVGFLLKEYVSFSDGTMYVQVVDKDGKMVIDDKWGFNEGDTALGILQEHYEIRSDDSWGMTFIYDIDDVKTDGYEYFFTLYVNDEMSMVGIDQVELVDGVIIKFEVTKYDPGYAE
ncbi:MAG: DUF4430 domain-containing protein [Bacilli bacterium]|nr:DUF4430 domain-containing protein [Bacilli bacterium]